jgi:hypothetical protein
MKFEAKQVISSINPEFSMPPSPPPTPARTMASPDVETSPPSTPTTTTSSCPTPQPQVTSPPTMSPELLRAARTGDVRRLVKALLADPAAPDMETAATAGGNTLLHVAASGGHADLGSLLLRRAPRLLAARNAALDTPLHLAARAGAHKVVAVLVATSSSSSPSSTSLRALTRATNRRGETALHDAVRGSHEAAARVLAAADRGLVGVSGGAGQPPLYMAAAAGSLGMVRLLVREYRNAEEEDDDEVPVLRSCTGPGGRTVLHAAVLASNGEFLASYRLQVLPCSVRHESMNTSEIFKI